MKTDLVIALLSAALLLVAPVAFAADEAGAADTVKELVRALNGGTDDEKEAAAADLADLGPAAEEAVPVLIKSLASGSPAVRRAAVRAIGVIRSAPGISVPALVGLLSDGSEGVRRAASNSLIIFGSESVPAMAKLLETGDAAGRQWAAYILAFIGADSDDARAALVKGLSDEVEFVRIYCAAALSDAGEPGPGAVRVLVNSPLIKSVVARTSEFDAGKARN